MPWSDSQLMSFRKMLAEDPGDDFRTVNEKRIPVADQLTFHYELVKPAIGPGNTILDLACGDGYGSSILSKQLFEIESLSSRSKKKGGVVIAGDISAETLKRARESHSDLGNVDWRILDAVNIDLESESIDLFTCFETLEHIPSLHKGIQEFYRILKFGGTGFFSTPQNCFGEFPMTYWHEKEFSREEILEAVQKYFKIERFIGIKQGTIFQNGDPVGSNSFIKVTKV
jgi:ubiquinone/menaquinone biosynthesis C-methylase UbiE